MTKKEEAQFFLREWKVIPKSLSLEEFDELYDKNEGKIQVFTMASAKKKNKPSTITFPINTFSKALINGRVKKVKFLRDNFSVTKKEYSKTIGYDRL